MPFIGIFVILEEENDAVHLPDASRSGLLQ
jgi:hypothetical protein